MVVAPCLPVKSRTDRVFGDWAAFENYGILRFVVFLNEQLDVWVRLCWLSCLYILCCPAVCRFSDWVPSGLPLSGGDATVYVFGINQLSLPSPCCSVLVSVSVFMALSTVLHFIILPETPGFLTLFLWSYFCPIGLFNYIYRYLYESLPQHWYNPLWLTGLKAQTN